MGAAEGTAARPEGTARGSERRGLRPGCSVAGRVRRAETLAASAPVRERHSGPYLWPSPPARRVGTGRVGGRGRAGRGPGRRGERGVPLGQRQPGRSDAHRATFPPLVFFLSQQPALPPRQGERPPRCPKVLGAAGLSPGGTAARPAVPAHTGVSFFLTGKQLPAPGQICPRLRGHKGNYCGGSRGHRGQPGPCGTAEKRGHQGEPGGAGQRRDTGTPRRAGSSVHLHSETLGEMDRVPCRGVLLRLRWSWTARSIRIYF
ncbi:collagen alpha-1(I) chain-like [Melospiza melodia melodia]|uniref:collagen alpha-1(I) chain-like n=1 Tax=Melospiza melodia melodia TaxID=1914991 RepID=UPI002FD6431F